MRHGNNILSRLDDVVGHRCVHRQSACRCISLTARRAGHLTETCRTRYLVSRASGCRFSSISGCRSRLSIWNVVSGYTLYVAFLSVANVLLFLVVVLSWWSFLVVLSCRRISSIFLAVGFRESGLVDCSLLILFSGCQFWIFVFGYIFFESFGDMFSDHCFLLAGGRVHVCGRIKQ